MGSDWTSLEKPLANQPHLCLREKRTKGVLGQSQASQATSRTLFSSLILALGACKDFVVGSFGQGREFWESIRWLPRALSLVSSFPPLQASATGVLGVSPFVPAQLAPSHLHLPAWITHPVLFPCSTIITSFLFLARCHCYLIHLHPLSLSFDSKCFL